MHARGFSSYWHDAGEVDYMKRKLPQIGLAVVGLLIAGADGALADTGPSPTSISSMSVGQLALGIGLLLSGVALLRRHAAEDDSATEEAP